MFTIRWSSIILRMIIGLRGMRNTSRLVIRIIRNLHRGNSRDNHHSRDSYHRDNHLKDNHHRESHPSDSNPKDSSHLRNTDSNEEGIVSNKETLKRSTAKIEYKSKNTIPQNSSNAIRAAAGSSTPTASASTKQSAGRSSRRSENSSTPKIKGSSQMSKRS